MLRTHRLELDSHSRDREHPCRHAAEQDERAEQQEDLEGEIAKAELSYFRGQGVGHGDWAPEPSFLILNVDEPQAHAWAEEYQQHAFVYGRHSEPARLVWVT